MLNAVRDNPERVEFVGYSTQRVRYIAFMISGMFSGIAGGLAAVNFELITAEVVGIDDNFVTVNAGLKSESLIPVEEFKNDRGEVEVSVGDFVAVAIESIEDRDAVLV
jgi:hypothetical protein